jgi:hypothetical protein
VGRFFAAVVLTSALACDCGSLESSRDTFCQLRPDVCDAGAVRDAGSGDAGVADAGPADAGRPDGGPSCSDPAVTEPFAAESVGRAINLKAAGPSCLASLTAYLDNAAPDAGSPPAMLPNDGGPAKVAASAFPVPYWVPVRCGPHVLVVLGFDDAGDSYPSAPISFTRTYTNQPGDGCDGG